MCSGNNNKTITSQTETRILVTARTISSTAINIRGRRGLKDRDRGKHNPNEWSCPKEADPKLLSKQLEEDTAKSMVDKDNPCRSTGNVEQEPIATGVGELVIGQGNVVLGTKTTEHP